MIETNTHQRDLRSSIDWKLIVSFLALVIIGWVNIYASIHSSEPSSIFDWEFRSGKQFIWILTSLALAGLILFVLNPGVWERLSVPIYVIVLFLLVAVIFLGVEVKGSRSWFEFGPVRFQPAEVSKISTSLLLAYVMSGTNFKISKFKDLLKVAVVIGLPMLIILAESETGSALVYAGFLFVLYREGFSGWIFMLIGMVVLLFILTLTASTYASVLTLIGVLSLCVALNHGKLLRWFLTWVPALVVLAFFPKIWAWICGMSFNLSEIEEAASASIGGEGILPALPMVFKSVPSDLQILLHTVKPYWILIGAGLLACPVLLVRSFRRKDNFLGLATLGFIAGVVLVFSTDFIFNNVLQDHQRKRIEVLLGMKEDPAGVGYNVNQSMIAIGSGGVFGKGFLHGTQTTYGFVPEQSTDFIFCTVGEEWGFVGCAVVILLYVFMIARILVDAEHARNSFTRIYGYCVASCIFMHLFINIGMTIGLMPVIGIPLPLLSYGGSSLWAFTILIFIFIALDHAENKYF